MRGKRHLSCGVDQAECVHSALQHGGMGGETAAGRPAGAMGGTDYPESGGSSPAGKRRETEQKKNNDLIGHVTQQCRCLTTAICYYHDLTYVVTTTI